ncbi:MAG: trypsin-like serine protease [Labilithrix sp.]|nr:trypsin-like serine protease [Labilithrix sp.]MCW5809385.1 trypsin-like serine protease [Labilithrix sp.]
MRYSLFALLTPFALFALVGCVADASEPASDAQEIIGGQLARDYPEAVLVDSDRGACSGTVIAPRVVLTAGHCVTSATRWTVTAPYAGGQRARSTKAWTKYTGAGVINPRAIDVAALTLDSPIELDVYPTIATEMARPNTKVRNVGRVRNGVVSNTALFIGREVTLERGVLYGYPNSYVADQVAENGDSGGPVYEKRPGTRKIVAVNSGGANGIEVLGRVDLVASDIARILREAEPEPRSTGQQRNAGP